MRTLPAVSTEFLKSSWGTSVAIHLGFAFGVAVIVWPRSNSRDPMDFEVFEQPTLATRAPVQLTRPIEEKKKEPEKRAVFGASRRALTDATDPNAANVKLGNTVAKDPDRERLRDDDADSIPIPVEEYLVTAMPVLEQEFRIPYPAEAKKANAQGRVVMDLLIDGSGRVRKADLVEGPGFGLNEAALEAVKNFRFKPARMQDRPVAVKIRYAYNFVLER
jgi:protein TonB